MKKNYKVNDDLTLEMDGRMYRLTKNKFNGCGHCPLYEIKGCDELCDATYYKAAETPSFGYSDAIFVEVTENKETAMKKDEIDYKALYEQEHKKYGDAVERMKSWMNGEHPECFSEAQKAAEFVFPELAESEEEKLSKKLHECVCRAINNDKLPYEERKYISEQVIPYLENLEKRKERKPVEQNPTWSEEDEKIRNEIIDYLERFIPHHEYDLVAQSKIWIAWLENLEKQKEQKATWSEEDEDRVKTVLYILHEVADNYNFDEWLKSLKEK